MILCFSSLFILGCGDGKTSNKDINNKEEKKESISNNDKFKIGALKGPTGIGMAKLMEDSKEKYEFSLYDSPDQVVSKIVNGELDGAAVPSNLASILYNKTKGKIQVAAINTLGILYVVENGNSIKSIKDLKGKTIYSSGKGATPEFVLNYILKENGLEPNKDVFIEYKMQHSDLAAAVASKKVDIALLPEPFITSVKMKDKDLKVSLNLTEEWNKVAKDGKLVMGVMIFNKDVIEKNKEGIDKFLDEYKSSVDYVNQNPKEASTIVEKQGIVPKAKLAEMAIPKCNIVMVRGKELKNYLDGFLKVLFQSSPKSVGGKLPDENFYYEAN
ncbi:ABC transporter substrate-binding protein [Haloimpatiens sp. FM7315]|uniref:ABC transporter substrate-binding protein n=1 Tax=Haloimpatiens sp. FM7315 TaxID=3298609 RepID=UPI00370CAFCA